MDKFSKYRGIIPAFYACYDDDGEVSADRTKALAGYLADKGVKGLYVGGSSGECIYQSVEERMKTLESVMEEVGARLTVIAHVACNNTADSMRLAEHAEKMGVDAIAAIPPIYFHLPPHAIAGYWNDISSAAPDTDFIIYNIPQLAGVALTKELLREMRKNPKLIGVKNSSVAAQDIQMFLAEGKGEMIVFNGPDEQLLSGLAMGAAGGIGGTYAVMPELYMKIYEHFLKGEMEKALEIQNVCCGIIYDMCTAKANLYAVQKEILKSFGVNIGTVRRPLPGMETGDEKIAEACAEQIRASIQRFC